MKGNSTKIRRGLVPELKVFPEGRVCGEVE